MLRERAIQYLKAQRISAEALMESASRPGNVIMEYKRLVRNAAMDEKTLFDLENQLRITELSAAKIIDPWELITEPTIIKNDSTSENFLISIFGLFLGTFIGFIIILFKEKNSGLLYEEKILKEIFKAEIFEKINLNKEIYTINSKDILNNEIFKKYLENNMVFIKSKLLSKENINKFSRLNFKDINNFSVINTFDSLQNKDRIILLTSLGFITKEESIKIINRLKMMNKYVEGIILLES